jgi:hypothetical protein
MKIIKTLGLLVISGLMFVSSANAASVYYQFINPGETADSYFNQTSPGTITDYIDFSIMSNNLLMRAAFDGFTDTVFDQANSTWALFSNTDGIRGNADDAQIASGLIFDPQYQFTGALAVGDYYFTLVSIIDTATVPDPARTQYELTVSQVPVPAAIWLFGSALVGFIGFGRRKAA